MGPKLGGKFFFSVCKGLTHIHDDYFDAAASPNFKQTFESSEAVWKSVLDEPPRHSCFRTFGPQEVGENFTVSHRNHGISATIWDSLCLKTEIVLVGFYSFIFN